MELVAEARVSTRTDPYLADYLLDGRTVLPPAIGLEAMAQAAAALAGRPLRDLADVSMEAPVVLPPGDRETTLRVCALLRDGAVETVLRAAGTGFSLDHFRAFFPLRPGAVLVPGGGRARAAGVPPATSSAWGRRCRAASWTGPTCTARSASSVGRSAGSRS